MEEAFFASAFATTLPEWWTWLKLTTEKLGSKCLTSSMIFPNNANTEDPWETAEIIVVESPSNITHWRPRLVANWTAPRQARASSFATVEESETSIDRAPRFEPRQSHTVAPIPAEFLCLKRAVSKFTFTKRCSRGCHWCCTTSRTGGASDHWLLMKSWSRVQAAELTFAIGRASRPKWRAFCLFHRLQEIVVNISNLNSSSTYINLLSKSLKLKGGGEIMDWNQWWVSHIGATWLQKQRAWRVLNISIDTPCWIC